MFVVCTRLTAIILLAFVAFFTGLCAATCRDAWCWDVAYGDRTFFVSSTAYSRSAAVGFCASKNATLAAPSIPAHAALSSSQQDSGWSAAVGTSTGIVLRDGPNATSFRAEFAAVWQPDLTGPTVMYDCFAFSNGSSRLSSINCTSAVAPAVCERSVAPASWVTHPEYGLAFGVYDVQLQRGDAVDFCRSLGSSAHLAYIPDTEQSGVRGLLASVRHADSPARVWIGHDPALKGRHGKFWTDMFVYGAQWDPTALGWKDDAVCTTWNLTDGTFLNSTRNTSAAVVCSRFAVPRNREYCFPATSTNLAYQFLPIRPTSESDAFGNFTMAAATAACSAAGGELVKFRNATELYDCFDRPAVYGLITAYQNGAWSDGSSEPIPAALVSLGSAPPCAYSLSSAGSPIASGVFVDCTMGLPAMCQFDTTSSVSFSVSQASVTVAQNCLAHIDVKLQHGLHAGVSYQVCRQSLPAGLQSATCVYFVSTNATAIARLAVVGSATSGASTLTLVAQCTPSSACSAAATVAVTINHGPRSTIRIGVGGATPSAALPLTSDSNSVGPNVTLELFVPGASVGGMMMNLSLASKSNADGCQMEPAFFKTSTSMRRSFVNVTCTSIADESAGSASFTLVGSFSDGDATGCNAGYGTNSWTGSPLELVHFVFRRSKTVSVAKAVDVPFHPFGISTLVPVVLSAVPSAGIELHNYVCVGAMSVTASAVTAVPSCVTSETQATTAQVAFSSADYAGMGDFNATLFLYGPGASQYNASRINVTFRLQRFNLTVNATDAVEYVAANITVQLHIPFSIPSGETLTVRVDPGLERPGDCIDLAPRLVPTGTFLSATTFNMQFLPSTTQCIQSGRYALSVIGSMSRFFNVVFESPRNFTIREGQPIGFSPRVEHLFLGATPVPIVVTLPQGFTDSAGFFGLQLYFAGRTDSPVVNSTAMTVQFTAGGVQEFTIYWSARQVGPGVPVSFKASPGSTAQFTVPQPFAVSVLERTNVTVSVLSEPFYFASAWYDASVTFERPPLTPSGVLLVSFAHENVEAEQLNITSTYPTLSGTFRFRVVGIEAGNVEPRVMLNGSAAPGYSLTNSIVALPPLTSQLTVFMHAPGFLLASDAIGATCAECTVRFSLSHSVRSSERVVVTLSTSSTLNISSHELIWVLGTQEVRTVQLTPLGPDESAMLNFSVVSFRRGTERNNEANSSQALPQSHKIVVRKTGKVGFSGWVNGDRPAIGDEYDLVVDRSVWMNITVSQLPSTGTTLRVIPVINDQPADTVLIDPPNATFSAESPRWVAVRFQGAKSYPGSGRARITFSLEGTGVPQFDPISGNYKLTIKGRDPITCDLPSIVVAGASQVPVVFQVNEEPAFELNVTMRAVPSVIRFVPEFVVWNASANKQRIVRMSAAQPFDTPVQIIAEPPAGSGYVGFSGTVTAARPSNVSVSFPTDRIYVREAASIRVSLGNPVVGATSLVVTGSTDSCGSCTSDTSLTFAGSLTSRFFSVYFNPTGTIMSPVVIGVTLTVDAASSAADQYVFEPRYASTVTFLPLRTVHVVDYPQPFYVGAAGEIILGVSELPDAGSWMSVRDDAGLATTTAMWLGTSNASAPAGNRSLSIQFVRPGRFNVSFLVTASSQQQRNRYVTAPTVEVEAVRKLEVSVADQLRPSQVTGAENNQSIRIVASRAPHDGHPVNVSLMFFSPLGDIVTVVPPVVTFLPTDSGSALIRTLSIVGTRRGEITNLRLKLQSSLQEELVAAEMPSFASSLIFEPKKVISFTGESESAYVDGRTDRAVNVSIDGTGYFGVTVALNFSTPGAVTFLQPILTFAPGDALWQFANYSCNAPVIDGSVTVVKVKGEEFSELVNGGVTFSIFPRIQPTVIFDQREINPGDVVSVATDIVSAVSVEVDAFQGVSGSVDERPVVYSLKVHRDLPLPIAPSFVELDPAELNFTRLARRRSFNVLTGALQPFAFKVEVISPVSRRFAPSFNMSLRAEVSIRVGVEQFPSVVFVGENNAAAFLVRPLIPVPARTFLQLRLDQSCGADIATVSPIAALDWNAGSTLAVGARIVGNSPGTCQLRVRRANADIRPSVATYVEESYQVIERPRVEWSNLTRLYDEPFLKYRTVRDAETALLVQGFNSGPAELAENLNFTVVGPGESPSVVASFVIRTTKTVEQEPLGILAQHRNQHPTLFRLDRSNERTNLVRFTLGPCAELLELEGESFTIEATSHAFGGVAPYQSNQSLRVDVGRYVANLVEENDIISTTVVSGLAAIASVSYAAPYSMQPSRANAFMWLLDCPDPDWKTRQYRALNLFTFTPDRVKFGTFDELGRWLMIALTNTGVMVGLAGLHVFVAASWFIQRKRGSTRTFTETCGRVHFPGLTLVVCFAWLLETVTAATRVMLYSPNHDFQVWGGLLLVPFALCIPYALSRLLWSNSSLRYTESVSRQSWKNFLVFRIMRPEGDWSHPSSPSFVARYGALFVEMRGNHRFFFLFEYACTIVYAVLSAVEPTAHRGCVAKAGCMTAVLAVQLCAIIAWRPYVREFTNFIFALSYGFQFIALTIVTSELGRRIRNDKLQRSAIALLIAGAAFQLVGGVWFLLFSIVQCFRSPKNKKDVELPDESDPEPSTKRKLQFRSRGLDDNLLGDADAERKNQRDDAYDDRSDDEIDADAQRAAELVEQRSVQPRGVFRGQQFRHGAVSYSPLRQQQLELHRTVAREPPRHATLFFEDSDDEGPPSGMLHPPVREQFASMEHVPMSTQRADAADVTPAASEDVRRVPCRFVGIGAASPQTRSAAPIDLTQL